MIDLHSHTNESDGTLTPAELVALARRLGLDALAITDHDTFAGYEKALPFAQEAGLDLVRGIELNSRFRLNDDSSVQYVHLLAYFPSAGPSPEFSAWLDGERDDRRSRNRRLVDALRRRGIEITLEEVEQRGRSLAGRPHFARILVEKGYAANSEDAFTRYIGEHAPTYVERQSQDSETVIRRIRDGKGIPVVAHPVRLGLDRAAEREALLRFKAAGLLGLEIYHSEHPPVLQAHYRQLADELGLLPTGGSDFHGGVKPDVQLGTGLRGNIRVPLEFLVEMRRVGNVQRRD